MTENIREVTDVFTWRISLIPVVCLLHRSINSSSSSWMQPRKSTLWSLFLGRPTAFCSWIRTSKSRRMSASCLSSGTRTNWGTAWLEETSASKPACMLGWFVIAWFREKGPTCAVYTVHPRRTSREPKTFADEGSRYSESWILRMFCFTDVCVPPVITSVVSEDSQIPPFFTSRWIPAVHKELYVCASVIWKFISPKWDSFLPPLCRSFKSPVPNLSAL